MAQGQLIPWGAPDACESTLPKYKRQTMDQTVNSVNEYDVTCSGGCQCTPSTRTEMGEISDGPTDYGNNIDCRWLISPHSSASTALISFQFTDFNTERNYDWVTVNRCTSSSCVTKEELARLSGDSINKQISYQASASHRHLQVVLTSDGGAVRTGFTGEWSGSNWVKPYNFECQSSTCGSQLDAGDGSNYVCIYVCVHTHTHTHTQRERERERERERLVSIGTCSVIKACVQRSLLVSY